MQEVLYESERSGQFFEGGYYWCGCLWAGDLFLFSSGLGQGDHPGGSGV